MAALGYAVFGETLSVRVALGAGIVMAAGVAMLWREHEARRIVLPFGRRQA